MKIHRKFTLMKYRREDGVFPLEKQNFVPLQDIRFHKKILWKT